MPDQGCERTPTPAPGSRVYNAPPIRGSTTAGGGTPADKEGEEIFDLPASKVVLRDVLVLRVEHEQIANPNYGAGMGADAGDQPAFLKGKIERLVILVHETDTEMLDFALYNGKISVGVRSYLVRDELEAGVEQPPTMGVTWTDFDEWFVSQRISATVYLSETMSGPASAAVPGRPGKEEAADSAQIVMARELDENNEPVQATNTFGPEDEFYFSVPMTVTKGSSVSVRWYLGDEMIYEESYTAEDDDATSVWGRLANEDAWPEGTYAVVIVNSSGEELTRTTFAVKEG